MNIRTDQNDCFFFLKSLCNRVKYIITEYDIFLNYSLNAQFGSNKNQILEANYVLLTM